jgi:hypothetical protein
MLFFDGGSIQLLHTYHGGSLVVIHDIQHDSPSSISLSCNGKCPGEYVNVYDPLANPTSIAGCESRDGPHCVDPTTVDAPYSQYQGKDFQVQDIHDL